MTFKKYAKMPLLRVASGTFDSASNRVAFTKSAGESNSLYSKADNKLNIREMLAMVANEYDLSEDPAHYIFEAARAVTADVPNENGDAFPKSELMRFDHRLGKNVYQTFILKPHHINHRADNPKTARGVVLDASYNSETPALETCPACNTKTAERSARDEATGLSCKKCGEVVKDEFVELLIAIDTKKDATFAEGVKTGALDSLSMGCEAGYTDCSICDNRARSASQFCAHIKNGKKQKHKTASGMKMSFEKCGDVVFTEISRVDQPADPTAMQREVFVGALPLQAETEMLIMSARLAKVETKQAADVPDPGPQTPFRSIGESIRWAEVSASRLKGEISRLAAEKDDKFKSAAAEGRPFYAWESAAFDSQIKASKQYVARLEDYVAKARELEASGEPWGKSLTRSMSRFFASKEAQGVPGQPAPGQPPEQPSQTEPGEINDTLDELGRLHPELYTDVVKNMNVDTGVAGPMSIGDYAKKLENDKDHDITTEEMGMMPDANGGMNTPSAHGASRSIEDKIASDLDALNDLFKENTVGTTKSMKFAAAYDTVMASVTSAGNIKVFTPSGSLFVVRPEHKPLGADGKVDKTAGEALISEILASVGDEGIVNTVQKYNTLVNPKMAQVLQHHVEDFAKGREEGDKNSPTHDHQTDMDHTMETPEKSPVVMETTDRKDEIRKKRNMGNADVLEKHTPDHADALPTGLTPVTDENHSDMRDDRKKPSKNPLKDAEVDRKDLKPKSAASENPFGGKKAPPFGEKESDALCASETCDVEGSHKVSDHKKKAGEDESDGPPEHEDHESPSDGPPEHDEHSDGGDEGGSELVIEMSELSDEDVEKLTETVEEMFGIDLEKLSDMLNKKLQTEINPMAQAAPDVSAGPPPGGGAPAPGGPSGGAPGMGAPAMGGGMGGMMASKTAGRIERLYKSRLEKATKAASDKLAGVTADAVKQVQGKMFRALNLAAKRQALNLEASPLKIHMFDVLSNELDIDTESFYPGMDSITASRIVETSVAGGYNDFVDVLVKRATEFMSMSDEAFNALEADVKNLRPASITVQAASQPVMNKSASLRKEASSGNLLLAPNAKDTEVVANVPSTGKRDNIRSALATTKISRTSGKLLTQDE